MDDTWETIETCPEGEFIWAFGGPFEKPTLRWATGRYWRDNINGINVLAPTHWRRVTPPPPPMTDRAVELKRIFDRLTEEAKNLDRKARDLKAKLRA